MSCGYLSVGTIVGPLAQRPHHRTHLHHGYWARNGGAKGQGGTPEFLVVLISFVRCMQGHKETQTDSQPVRHA